MADIFAREQPAVAGFHVDSSSHSPLGVVFELWSKSLYPNARERLIARALLPLDKLVSTASYVLQLVDQARFDLHDNNNTTHAGQLFVAVSYRCEELTYNLPSMTTAANPAGNQQALSGVVNNFLVPFRSKLEVESCVTLSVGVLRAYGLEATASEFLKRHHASHSSLVTLENSNLYVKFSLGFLNRPQVINL